MHEFCMIKENFWGRFIRGCSTSIVLHWNNTIPQWNSYHSHTQIKWMKHDQKIPSNDKFLVATKWGTFSEIVTTFWYSDENSFHAYSKTISILSIKKNSKKKEPSKLYRSVFTFENCSFYIFLCCSFFRNFGEQWRYLLVWMKEKKNNNKYSYRTMWACVCVCVCLRAHGHLCVVPRPRGIEFVFCSIDYIFLFQQTQTISVLMVSIYTCLVDLWFHSPIPLVHRQWTVAGVLTH